jgi:hypothetical protein
MDNLYQERQLIQILKGKIEAGESLTSEEILDVIDQFEETVELAAVSMKIIDRMRVNYSHLKVSNGHHSHGTHVSNSAS